MGHSTTLGRLSRREALLASLVALATARLAPGLALDILPLQIVGWVVAALAAIEGARIVHRRIGVEGRREADTLRQRTRAPIGRIEEIDPTRVGVDAAAQSILPGEGIPEYVPRDVDAELREAIGAAFAGEGRQIVVVASDPSQRPGEVAHRAVRTSAAPDTRSAASAKTST